MARVIELKGGPLDGDYHEVHADWPVPEKFGLPKGNKLHWYIVDGNTATYERSTSKRIPNDI